MGSGNIYREIFISVDCDEIRVAIMENHSLMEFLVEPVGSRKILGNIFKGRIKAVLPGMQAAFVDIGIGKNAFLPFSDVCGDYLDIGEMFMDETVIDENLKLVGNGSGRRNYVEDLIQKDQEILVQVIKEPMGSKGARITTQISLPGRFVVLLPWTSHIGVSKKIEDREERARLKSIAREFDLPPNVGVIVRTAAEGRSDREILDDIAFLIKQWKKTESRAKKIKAPSVASKELNLPLSLVRDVFSSDVDLLVIDSPHEYDQILKYLKSTAPDLRGRVKLYEKEIPLFEQYRIEEEIERSLRRRVWLKRGGYIVIDIAEALTAIDVNTGKYIGRDDQETTILEVNLEAAHEIARQLRLRDIGGIIVIDFIDMINAANWEKVFRCLEESLERDRLKTKTLNVSEIGLVEMTRKKVRPTLWERYTETCPTCDGTGRVLSRFYTVRKIERHLVKLHLTTNARNFVIRMNPEMALYLLEERDERIADLKSQYGIELEVIDDPVFDSASYQILPRGASG